MCCPSSEFSENSESIGACLSYNTHTRDHGRQEARPSPKSHKSQSCFSWVCSWASRSLACAFAHVPPAKMRGIQQQWLERVKCRSPNTRPKEVLRELHLTCCDMAISAGFLCLMKMILTSGLMIWDFRTSCFYLLDQRPCQLTSHQNWFLLLIITEKSQLNVKLKVLLLLQMRTRG